MCGDDKPTVAEARHAARIVFLGEVIALEYEPVAPTQSGKAREELTARFHVERVWKGNLAREVVLFTEQYQAPDFSISVVICAYQFTVGKRYVVFAGVSSADQKPRALYCSRTAEVEKAREDLRALGRGKKPRKAAGQLSQTAKPNKALQLTAR
jgi:hypothetical protein